MNENYRQMPNMKASGDNPKDKPWHEPTPQEVQSLKAMYDKQANNPESRESIKKDLADVLGNAVMFGYLGEQNVREMFSEISETIHLNRDSLEGLKILVGAVEGYLENKNKKE